MITLRNTILIIRAFYLSITLIIILIIGFLINILQICILCLPISSKPKFFVIKWLCERWWLLQKFILINHSNIQLHFYHDDKLIKNHQQKYPVNLLNIINHSQGIDFLMGAVLTDYFSLQNSDILIFLKKNLIFFPVFGFIHYLQGSTFIHRNWSTDKTQISHKINQIVSNEIPRNICFILFPEGTRKTSAKIIKSQQYSVKNGYPVLKNVLLPRYKGFNLIMKSTRKYINVVNDVTFAYDPYPLNLTNLLFTSDNKKPSVHINIKSYNVADLPENSEGLKKWLISCFEKKDVKLSYFRKTKRFEEDLRLFKITDPFMNFVVIFLLFILLLYFMGVVGKNGVFLYNLYLVVLLWRCDRMKIINKRGIK